MSRPTSETLVIAEIGVNHDGNVKQAKELVDAAREAGADVAKFQIFKAERLVTNKAPTAEYQARNTKSDQSQFELLRQLELSESNFAELSEYCAKRNIEFMASGFSTEDISMAVSLGVQRLKIPSGEITNLPYLRVAASFGLPIILSTGMANIAEIREALVILEESGLERSLVTVLHCTTDYPTALPDVNLRAMVTIHHELGVNVGYSDHTEGTFVAPIAVGLGAKVIEKHLTIRKDLKGPDHLASLEPLEFRSMVANIRLSEQLLGTGLKVPTESELANRLIARKSIVAARDISLDEEFSSENLAIKRPGNGVSPMAWDRVVGSTAKRAYKKDELIET